MDTGLKYEGEAARKRFVVYWLRPAVAALAFGLFTFMVVSVPSEKEKIQLRGEVQRLRQETETHQAKLREMLPLANSVRAEHQQFVPLNAQDDPDGWGHVLFDGKTGTGIVFVTHVEAEGKRAFCWWFDLDRNRHPLAAIELTRGTGYAAVRVPNPQHGSFLITLEELEGEPSSDSPPLIESAIY